jgi:hypothetical protein
MIEDGRAQIAAEEEISNAIGDLSIPNALAALVEIMSQMLVGSGIVPGSQNTMLHFTFLPLLCARVEMLSADMRRRAH